MLLFSWFSFFIHHRSSRSLRVQNVILFYFRFSLKDREWKKMAKNLNGDYGKILETHQCSEKFKVFFPVTVYICLFPIVVSLEERKQRIF